MLDDLMFITPDWSVPSCVKALTSTRKGGSSQPPFDSLNVGLHVNDRSEDVIANRIRLTGTAKVPNEPVWLNQIHSSVVIELGHNKFDCILDCDGSVTKQRNTVCAIMTADCLPLFICNTSGDQVGLLHVGWRGLAEGIIEKGIQLFDDLPCNLITWAGPCISLEHFEVGEEVRDQLGGSDDAYSQSSKEGKVYANLYQLTCERLAALGVTTFSHSQHCTYRDDALFFSHRRDKQTGRMVSLIWIE